MIHKKLKYEELGVTLPDVYEQMGYGVASDIEIKERVGEDVKAEVQKMLQEIRMFLEPELCFFIGKGELDEVNNTLQSSGKTMSVGKIITRQLRQSSIFAFFVCTAGKAFQDYQERLKAEGDVVREFTANAIGSVLAEKTADTMERELENFLDGFKDKQLHHTNRFSPGYCGWHVREQKLLFSTFPLAEPCGVKLTDSCLMLPIKSVSGVIGIGENVRKLEYTCGLCDYANCYKRRKKKA
mgnify:CR=1 FL=1